MKTILATLLLGTALATPQHAAPSAEPSGTLTAATQQLSAPPSHGTSPQSAALPTGSSGTLAAATQQASAPPSHGTSPQSAALPTGSSGTLAAATQQASAPLNEDSPCMQLPINLDGTDLAHCVEQRVVDESDGKGGTTSRYEYRLRHIAWDGSKSGEGRFRTQHHYTKAYAHRDTIVLSNSGSEDPMRLAVIAAGQDHVLEDELAIEPEEHHVTIRKGRAYWSGADKDGNPCGGSLEPITWHMDNEWKGLGTCIMLRLGASWPNWCPVRWIYDFDSATSKLENPHLGQGKDALLPLRSTRTPLTWHQITLPPAPQDSPLSAKFQHADSNPLAHIAPVQSPEGSLIKADTAHGSICHLGEEVCIYMQDFGSGVYAYSGNVYRRDAQGQWQLAARFRFSCTDRVSATLQGNSLRFHSPDGQRCYRSLELDARP